MPKKRNLKNLKLKAIAAVDRPCQEGAVALVIKRRADEPGLADTLLKYIDTEDGAHTFSEVLQENKFDEAIWPMTSAFSQSIRSIMADRNINPNERDTKVRTTVDEFLSSVGDLSPKVEKQLVELISQKENLMPKTVEQLQAEIDTLKGQNATMATDLSTAQSALKMSDKEKDKMKDELEQSKTEKAALIEKAADPDKALATAKGELTAAQSEIASLKADLVKATDESIEVGGKTVFKSAVGEASFELAKGLADERDMARIEKRVETDFSHVAGTVSEKALALSHIDKLPDEAKKAVTAILVSAEKMAAGGFAELGYQGGETPTIKAAQDTFATKVSEVQTRDKISKAQAMSKARVEFPAEFAASQG